jgi:hypothetical protein
MPLWHRQSRKGFRSQVLVPPAASSVQVVQHRRVRRAAYWVPPPAARQKRTYRRAWWVPFSVWQAAGTTTLAVLEALGGGGEVTEVLAATTSVQEDLGCTALTVEALS